VRRRESSCFVSGARRYDGLPRWLRCNANSRTDARPEPPIASAPGVGFGADCERSVLLEIAPDREMQ